MTTEREFTAWLGRLFAFDPRRVPVGIGDDAAVVRNHGRETVVACDPVVEGVHFDAGTPARLAGRKAVHRNLSDLAAMGAAPDYLVVSALLPPALPPPRRKGVFVGIRDAAEEAGCLVVGGDVAATPGPLTLTVTALGHLPGRALRRSGARPGDAIHVTGPLGGARLGHHLRFRPHLSEGVWLARHGAVTAAMDVSDGLGLDLATLLRASGGLGAELDETRIPLAPAARRAARGSGRSPLEHALSDGEDHVLVFTVRGGARLPRGGPLAAVARTPIGRVTETPGLRLLDRHGGRRALPVAGWQHELDRQGPER